MNFYALVKDYVLDEAKYSDEITSEKREKLVAALIRESDKIGRFEFISEHSESDNLPFYLANVLDNCREEDRERLPVPIKVLIQAMVAGALEFRKKEVEQTLKNERVFINSRIYLQEQTELARG